MSIKHQACSGRTCGFFRNILYERFLLIVHHFHCIILFKIFRRFVLKKIFLMKNVYVCIQRYRNTENKIEEFRRIEFST